MHGLIEVLAAALYAAAFFHIDNIKGMDMQGWKRKDTGVHMEEQGWLEGSLPILTFPALNEISCIRHGFTTRDGGVSQGDLASLNLSFNRGDQEENVRENYHRIALALEVPEDRFVLSKQEHTDHVRVITEADAGKGLVREMDYAGVDGLVTNVKKLVLFTSHADCTPLYFVDPVHEVIGLSHSGWKGTVKGIGRATLEKMQEVYGTDPADVICGIGPSICQDCYEISEDVAQQFQEKFGGHEEEILINKKNGHYQLDLWKANQIILEEAGVKKEHISLTDLCTCCNSKRLFSHRASHGKRGNLAAFMMLKGE